MGTRGERLAERSAKQWADHINYRQAAQDRQVNRDDDSQPIGVGNGEIPLTVVEKKKCPCCKHDVDSREFTEAIDLNRQTVVLCGFCFRRQQREGKLRVKI